MTYIIETLAIGHQTGHLHNKTIQGNV